MRSSRVLYSNLALEQVAEKTGFESYLIFAEFSANDLDIPQANTGANLDMGSILIDACLGRLRIIPDFLERAGNEAAHTLHFERYHPYQVPERLQPQPIAPGS